MEYAVCLDDGCRDLSEPPLVIKDKYGYLIDFDETDFVIDIIESVSAVKAREAIAIKTNLSEEDLVTYTLEECKSKNKGERQNG